MKYTSIPNPLFSYEDFERYYQRVFDRYDYPILEWLSNPDTCLSEMIILMLYRASDKLDTSIVNNPITRRLRNNYLNCPDESDVPETDAQIRVLFFMEWAYHVRH